MLWLLLATICSASLALIFRASERRGLDRYAITAVNYLAAVAVSLGVGLIRNPDVFRPGSWTVFRAETGQVLGGSGASFGGDGSFWWACLVGLAAGGVFFVAFVLYQLCIRTHGAGISGMYGKLGVLLPTLLSLLVWRNLPTRWQWFGILLALTAIVTSQLPRHGDDVPGREGSGWSWARVLPAGLLISMGLAEFANKVFQAYALIRFRSLFLLCVFGSALVIALVVLRVRRAGIGRREWAFGLAVGVPNLLSSYFLIMALGTVKAAVAFPVFSAGSVVLIALGAWGFHRERLRAVDWAALGLTAVGLALIAG